MKSSISQAKIYTYFSKIEGNVRQSFNDTYSLSFFFLPICHPLADQKEKEKKSAPEDVKHQNVNNVSPPEMPLQCKPSNVSVNIQGKAIISTVRLCEYQAVLVSYTGIRSHETCYASKPSRQVARK